MEALLRFANRMILCYLISITYLIASLFGLVVAIFRLIMAPVAFKDGFAPAGPFIILAEIEQALFKTAFGLLAKAHVDATMPDEEDQ